MKGITMRAASVVLLTWLLNGAPTLLRAQPALGNADAAGGGQDSPPLRIVSVDGPTAMGVGELVNFRVRIADGAERPIIHRWDMGDGTQSEGNNVSHRYKRPGHYRIIATVWNRSGNDTESLAVTVTDRRPVRLRLEVLRDSIGATSAAAMDPTPAKSNVPLNRDESLRGSEPINWSQAGYTLLAISASSRSAAEAAALKFRRKGYRSGIYLDDSRLGSAVFRVVVGQFGSELDAVAARNRILRESLHGAFIVAPLPSQ